MDATPITLRADGAGLTLAPEVGGAVVRYWLERGSTTWEWLRPTPPAAVRARLALQTAAFLLVPYSNRIRAGRFAFRGRAVALPLNRPPERHAIHGHGWQRRGGRSTWGRARRGSSTAMRRPRGRGPTVRRSASPSPPRASR